MGMLGGTITIEILSPDPTGTIRTLLQQGISLHHAVITGELRIKCSIHRQDYFKLQSICNQKGYSVTILHRSGAFWVMQSLLYRPVLVLGLCALILFCSWISTLVLFIQVEGNEQLPDRQIIEAARGAGIYFGASRRELRSEKVKNTLLEAVPELKWACVNTYGCVAKISVRERTEPEQVPKRTGLGSIVAHRDGVITNCTATRGTLLCRPGMAVKKGETLISGYTDCGIYIQATQAEGEVYARTMHHLKAVISSDCLIKTEEVKISRGYSLIAGKKRINLWKDSGISDTLCDRMYEEYYIVLPGGFSLPVALAVDTYIFRDTAEGSLSPDRGEPILRTFAQSYLVTQMVAGSIQDSDVQVTNEDSVFCLEGTYLCTEMIARQQPEQIGE